MLDMKRCKSCASSSSPPVLFMCQKALDDLYATHACSFSKISKRHIKCLPLQTRIFIYNQVMIINNTRQFWRTLACGNCRENFKTKFWLCQDIWTLAMFRSIITCTRTWQKGSFKVVSDHCSRNMMSKWPVMGIFLDYRKKGYGYCVPFETLPYFFQIPA
jgi:hypothetical protein